MPFCASQTLSNVLSHGATYFGVGGTAKGVASLNTRLNSRAVALLVPGEQPIGVSKPNCGECKDG